VDGRIKSGQGAEEEVVPSSQTWLSEDESSQKDIISIFLAYKNQIVRGVLGFRLTSFIRSEPKEKSPAGEKPGEAVAGLIAG
jgi:hypothetical protein